MKSEDKTARMAIKIKNIMMIEECRCYYSCAFCLVFALGFLLLVSFPAFSMYDPALKEGFVPHKALYDIRLTSKKSSANISNIRGKMLYEWHSTCEGWVSSHKFDMLYEYIEVPSVHITSEFATYESFDGKEFNFTVQRKKDNYVFEEFRGVATFGDMKEEEKQTSLGHVSYSIPFGLTQDLPQATLFPTAHTLDVLKHIKKGDHFYKANLFDGSDTEGPVEINTFIGKETAYQSIMTMNDKGEFVESKYIDPDLINTKVWKIRLAFFPLNTFDVMADYEMSAVFHENGIISSMKIDYEDFSITQRLIALEPIESGCIKKSSHGEGQD
ncbi:MAG: DUF1849 family protein [Alphaproteobacteria bacterium]|nr:DUF1849 family protein [Alphaproteobacteria bacterium]